MVDLLLGFIQFGEREVETLLGTIKVREPIIHRGELFFDGLHQPLWAVIADARELGFGLGLFKLDLTTTGRGHEALNACLLVQELQEEPEHLVQGLGAEVIHAGAASGSVERLPEAEKLCATDAELEEACGIVVGKEVHDLLELCLLLAAGEGLVFGQLLPLEHVLKAWIGAEEAEVGNLYGGDSGEDFRIA